MTDSFLSEADRLAILRGAAATYEAEALRAQIRADAAKASGNKEQLESEQDQADRASAAAAAIAKQFNAAVADAKKRGYSVSYQADSGALTVTPAKGS